MEFSGHFAEDLHRTHFYKDEVESYRMFREALLFAIHP